MSKEVIEVLKAKRDVAIEEREIYNFDSEQKEIDTLEKKMNEVIARRESKKSIYNSHDIEVQRITTLIEGIKEVLNDTEQALPDEREEN